MSESGETGFIMVNVEDGTFTEPVQLRFRFVGLAKRVDSVRVGGRLLRAKGLERFSEGLDMRFPAFAMPVEDSGAGVSWLVIGGNAGLWLSPREARGLDPEDKSQVFESYLLVDRADIVLADDLEPDALEPDAG